ncbi:hypothetical protein ACWD4V_02255 [Streptomyces tsukubensis]
MSTAPFTAIFFRLDRRVTTHYADHTWCLHTTSCPGPLSDGHADLRQLRHTAMHGDPESRAALWQHLGHRACAEPTGTADRPWTLLVLWLLAPRLKAASLTIARRTGADKADVCSTTVLGALEGLSTLARAHPSERPEDVEAFLIHSAFEASWRTGRSGSRERPMADVEPVSPDTSSGAHRLPVPSRVSIVEATRMTQALMQQANGERLGALAHRLGLMPHVREVRRLRHGRQPTPSAVKHSDTSVQGHLFPLRRSQHGPPTE